MSTAFDRDVLHKISTDYAAKRYSIAKRKAERWLQNRVKPAIKKACRRGEFETPAIEPKDFFGRVCRSQLDAYRDCVRDFAKKHNLTFRETLYSDFELRWKRDFEK